MLTISTQACAMSCHNDNIAPFNGFEAFKTGTFLDQGFFLQVLHVPPFQNSLALVLALPHCFSASCA
jgi:hypothetical protein